LDPGILTLQLSSFIYCHSGAAAERQIRVISGIDSCVACIWVVPERLLSKVCIGPCVNPDGHAPWRRLCLAMFPLRADYRSLFLFIITWEAVVIEAKRISTGATGKNNSRAPTAQSTGASAFFV